MATKTNGKSNSTSQYSSNGKSSQTTQGKSQNSGSQTSSQYANSQSKSTYSGVQSKSQSSREETTLEKLFEDGLKDIYSAEKQLVEALPKMAKAADSEDLEQAFTRHLEQTKKQVERLEKIMDRLEIEKTVEKECEAMKGLISEGEEIIEKYKASPVRDAALIMAAQKVEHYEIATYGSLREFADVLGMRRECDLLNRTLQEEGDTDHDLSRLAMEINDDACALADQEKFDDEW